ncbi:hypothetical protein [Stutzerimonas nitrititolerans]|uniref:hypothetical protein n=1 Tax=Stutzerimonas nitrititolerans TaxID=2482751 RepID=UPI00289A985F|nr:hypothetical protein [Stutzerimonas nitrititolerans]
MTYSKREPQSGPVTEEDLTFSLSQLMEYLAAKGRSTQCPMCPHNGEWIFHTGTDDETDPRVLIFGCQNSSEQGVYTPFALMECPRCGFMPSTSLFAVHHYFKDKKNG